jgi:hypothetical protein
MQTYFFLLLMLSLAVYDLVKVKKIQDPEKIHPGSGSRIPDPKGKKAPDPASGSTTLTEEIYFFFGCRRANNMVHM